MKKNKGFSLIELMVVIAIVAILAVVALPAYKTYLIKSKLVTASNFVQSQVDASIRYYNEKGVFGNIKQIGLPSDSGDDTHTPDPTTNGYLQGYVGQMNMSAYNDRTCPSASVGAYVSNFGGGDATVDPDTADIVVLQYVFFDKDGIINKRCQYTYYQGGMTNGTAMSGSYVADCVNTADNPGNEAAVAALTNSCT